jgi:hypothetical protein
MILVSSSKSTDLDWVLIVSADHWYVQEKAEDKILNLEELHAL